MKADFGARNRLKIRERKSGLPFPRQRPSCERSPHLAQLMRRLGHWRAPSGRGLRPRLPSLRSARLARRRWFVLSVSQRRLLGLPPPRGPLRAASHCRHSGPKRSADGRGAGWLGRLANVFFRREGRKAPAHALPQARVLPVRGLLQRLISAEQGMKSGEADQGPLPRLACAVALTAR